MLAMMTLQKLFGRCRLTWTVHGGAMGLLRTFISLRLSLPSWMQELIMLRGGCTAKASYDHAQSFSDVLVNLCMRWRFLWLMDARARLNVCVGHASQHRWW